MLWQRSCEASFTKISIFFSCPHLCHYSLLFFRVFLHFFPSFSPGTPPVLFPSPPFLPLSHAVLFGFSLSNFTPSCLLLSSLFCLHCPPCPDYSTFLPSASFPPFISHSPLLILLFLPFIPLLLSAIILFTRVFLSKYCHLALPQSSYWASLWIAYVHSSRYALARLSCQYMFKKQDINIHTLRAFGSKEICYQKKPQTIFAFIHSLDDGIGREIHSVIVLTPQGILRVVYRYWCNIVFLFLCYG